MMAAERAKLVPVRESRVATEPTAEGLRVTMPLARSFWKLAFPLYGLAILGLGLVMMLAGPEPADGEAGPPAFFAVLWCVCGLPFVFALLWRLRGREEAELAARTLTLSKRLGRWGRSRSFARERIEGIRVSPEAGSVFDPRSALRWMGFGGGVIAFDYGARTYRFGDMEEAEAKHVVAALRQHLGQAT
jgi:hypothetical protein